MMTDKRNSPQFTLKNLLTKHTQLPTMSLDTFNYVFIFGSILSPQETYKNI